MNGQNQNQKPSQNQQGFNCVLAGIGYLNPSQWVEPAKGESYRVAKLSLLEGQDGKNIIKCDCIISDRAAENLDFIEELVAQYEGEAKVICSVRIGVKGINTFQKSNGEVGNSIRGRLIRITSVSVNGDRYELPDAQRAGEEADQSDETPNEESPEPMPAAAPLAKAKPAAPVAPRPSANVPARAAARPMPQPMAKHQNTGIAQRAPQGRVNARPAQAARVPAR
jgi:hypothetical protein